MVSVRQSGGVFELVDDGGTPLADANRFLAALAVRGLSPRTVRAYAFDLVSLHRWLAGRQFARLVESDLLDWIARQRAGSAAPRSTNRRLTTARIYFRFLTGREIARGAGVSAPAPHYAGRGRDRVLGLHAMPRLARVHLRVKEPDQIVEPLTPDEVRAFLRSLRRYRDLALVHLLLLCGLRSREVITLRLCDVVFDERRLRVRGKGDKERVVPLPDLALQSLSDYLRVERPRRCPSDILFVVLQGKHRGEPMTPAGLRRLFRWRRQKPGLGRANPHRWRHTFGADMARAGVRLPILQRLLGHADARITLRYIHLSMADLADEYHRAVAEIEKRYPSG